MDCFNGAKNDDAARVRKVATLLASTIICDETFNCFVEHIPEVKVLDDFSCKCWMFSVVTKEEIKSAVKMAGDMAISFKLAAGVHTLQL